MPETLLDPTTLGDLLRVASAFDYHRWEEQIRRTGGCADPIHLTGWVVHRDKTTGETLHHYSTEGEPGGRLRLACGNRRASRCPSCAWTYAGDTYHLIRAGLAGDDRRDIPATVRDHPGSSPLSPHPRSARSTTAPIAASAAAALATLLTPRSWAPPSTRTRTTTRARCCSTTMPGSSGSASPTGSAARSPPAPGITQRELKERARLSYGKVAEFQKRGALHFHAVIRIDGPDGPDTPPPSWATVDMLADAIRAAAAHPYTSVSVPAAEDQPARTFRWGTQLDVRPVKAFGDGSEITEQAVASYVAKYATKAAENTGTLDRRIGELAELDRHGVPDHTRRLIEACKTLDPLYPDRRLWAWAHMLGFRGHFSTKSRRYSTTLGALRQARADYRAAQEHAALGLDDDREPDTVLVLADWQYAGHGHTPGESVLAATIARDLQLNRETAREELALLSDEKEW